MIPTGNAGFFVGTNDGKIVRIKNEQIFPLITINNNCKTLSNESTQTFVNFPESARESCPRISAIVMSDKRDQTIYFNDVINGIYAATPSSEKIKLNHMINKTVVNANCRSTQLIDDILVDDKSQEHVIVYFIDVSGKFDANHGPLLHMQPETDGRLIKFDGKSSMFQVLLDSLWSPSGLVMMDDGEHLLLTESVKRRVIKYNLKTATTENFIDYLPGEPMHIRR